MKAIFVNGSPRKNWNTYKLLSAAMRGASENGAETELVNLYDHSFKGCQSCFACKLKGSTTNGVCAIRDELRPVLERIMDADVLVVGSPVYFGDLTSGTLAFLERLQFPVLNYKPPVNGQRPRTLPKEKKLGFIIDMNVTEADIDKMGYPEHFGGVTKKLAGLLGNGECPVLYSCDTYQFSDYSRYDVTSFDEAAKRKHLEERFPLDLEKAYQLGKLLTAE